MNEVALKKWEISAWLCGEFLGVFLWFLLAVAWKA